MAEVFKWRPLSDATGTISFKVLTAQFGDGYKASAEDGINNRAESWPLQFGPDRATVVEVSKFLDRHAGARTFLWTPPLGEQGYYEVTQYTKPTNKGGIYYLSATFAQAFRP